jgi:hypothetical protein
MEEAARKRIDGRDQAKLTAQVRDLPQEQVESNSRY